MTKQISEERLRNTRAWAAARVDSLSGADVIVGAIDELLRIRELSIHMSSGGKPDEPVYTRADVSALVGIIRANDPETGTHEPGADPAEVRARRNFNISHGIDADAWDRELPAEKDLWLDAARRQLRAENRPAEPK
jgi:hypothetical protein